MRTTKGISNPVLPQIPDADQGSYVSRLQLQIDRELRDIKAASRLTYEDRLSGYYSATAAPTGGKWVAGDRVRNSAPAEAGGAGSKYVIIGWICTVTGSPGTWLEMRTLTGN